MDFVARWAWPAFLAIMWAYSAWGLIAAARTGRAAVVRGWSFERKSEPVEYWFLVGTWLIVLVGVLWIALEGW